MTQLVLTEEQSKLAATAGHSLQVQDSNGNVLGTFSPFWTEEELVEARSRLASKQSRYTTAQLLDYLRSLRSS